MNKNKPGMINKHIIDARNFNIGILPPDINKSKMNFSVYDNSILFGLSAITGIGESIADIIINERTTNGKFVGFDDLTNRVPLKKTQIIALIKSGAIPTKDKKKFLINYFKSQYEIKEYQPVATYPSKLKLLTEWDINVDDYKVGKKVDKEAVLQLYNKKKEAVFKQEQTDRYRKYIEECNEKYLQDEQYWEFETLEFFVSDVNPFEQAYDILPEFDDVPIGEDCVIVGIVSKIQKKKTKKGDQFAFINVYGTSLVEGTVWPDALKKFQDLIVKGTQVAISCRKESEDQVIVNKMKSYAQWLEDTKHLRKK
jgi:DNA polymerase-3 subunit alpha